MDKDSESDASTITHKILSGVSGALGGAFGLPALAVELPISSSIILRSIADIARSEGEDITTLQARLACLEVFALGGRSDADDGAETGYFAVRAVLAKAVSDAAKHIAAKGLTEKGAPAIARLVTQLASRFGAVVSPRSTSYWCIWRGDYQSPLCRPFPGCCTWTFYCSALGKNIWKRRSGKGIYENSIRVHEKPTRR
jgi:hypothetical protein